MTGETSGSKGPLVSADDLIMEMVRAEIGDADPNSLDVRETARMAVQERLNAAQLVLDGTAGQITEVDSQAMTVLFLNQFGPREL